MDAAAPRLVNELLTLLLFDGGLHQKPSIIRILPKQITYRMKLAENLLFERFLTGKIVQRSRRR